MYVAQKNTPRRTGGLCIVRTPTNINRCSRRQHEIQQHDNDNNGNSSRSSTDSTTINKNSTCKDNNDMDGRAIPTFMPSSSLARSQYISSMATSASSKVLSLLGKKADEYLRRGPRARW